MKRTSKRNFAAAFSALAFALGIFTQQSSLAATTWTVTNANDTGTGSLRAAVASAASGDTIVFASSVNGKTIKLASQIVIPNILTISGPGSDTLTISGNNKTRVFYVSGGIPTSSAIIRGLTITKGNGNGPDPSGFGFTTYGGAIYNAGYLEVDFCTITDNKAAGSGGAIYNRGSITVNDTAVTYSVAGTAGSGGGIFNDGSNLLMQRCTIANNTSKSNGGGIEDTGTTTLINSTIAANTAVGSGGGMDAQFDTLNTYNCTIALNSAAQGGGLCGFQFGSSWQLRNTIVANNCAGTGPDISNPFGTLVSLGYNLIGSTSGAATGSFVASDQTNMDPKLGPLQDNNGQTNTMALLPGSPAIDKGSNALLFPPSPASSMTTDQRGNPFARVYLGVAVGTVDVGAFEFVAPKDLKTDAYNVVVACLATSGLDSDTICNLQLAKGRISSSLRPCLWSGTDKSRLTNWGELVFEFEEEAVAALLNIVCAGGPCADAAQDAITDLVMADDVLARVAINDAVASGCSSSSISYANCELNKAVAARVTLKYVQAIEYYEQAWIAAQHCKGCNTGRDDDSDQTERERPDSN